MKLCAFDHCLEFGQVSAHLRRLSPRGQPIYKVGSWFSSSSSYQEIRGEMWWLQNWFTKNYESSSDSSYLCSCKYKYTHNARHGFFFFWRSDPCFLQTRKTDSKPFTRGWVFYYWKMENARSEGILLALIYFLGYFSLLFKPCMIFSVRCLILKWRCLCKY